MFHMGDRGKEMECFSVCLAVGMESNEIRSKPSPSKIENSHGVFK